MAADYHDYHDFEIGFCGLEVSVKRFLALMTCMALRVVVWGMRGVK